MKFYGVLLQLQQLGLYISLLFVKYENNGKKKSVQRRERLIKSHSFFLFFVKVSPYDSISIVSSENLGYCRTQNILQMQREHKEP